MHISLVLPRIICKPLAILLSVSLIGCFATSKASAGLQDSANLSLGSIAKAEVNTDRIGNFESAFEWLAAKFKVAFVAEDAPRDPALSATERKRLIDSLSKEELAQDELIRRIAEAYDYSAEPQGAGNVYTLTKRYTRDNDLPFVTFDEAIHALTNIIHSANGLNPHASINGPNAPITRFAQSLTPDQENSLRTTGLSLSSLPKDQQQILWDWNLQAYVQKPMDTVEKIIAHLKVARTQRPVYRWMNLFGTSVRVFGYEGAFDGGQALSQYGLSHGIEAQPLNGANLIHVGEGWNAAVNRLTDPITLSDKTESDKFTNDFLQRVKNGEFPDPTAPVSPNVSQPSESTSDLITLSNLVERLNKGKTDFHAEVEDDLAAKPVTLIGSISGLPPRQILDAAARVYGLRVLERTDKSLVITLYTPPVARDYAELGVTLSKAFPAPWKRAFFGGEQREEAKLLEANPQKPDPGKDPAYVQRRTEAFLRSRKSLYSAAVRRLRTLVEPKVAAAPDGRFPMADADDEAKRMLVLIYIADRIGDLQGWSSASVPLCLSDFKDTVFVGGRDTTQGAFGLIAKTQDKNGIWRIENNIRVTDASVFGNANPVTNSP